MAPEVKKGTVHGEIMDPNDSKQYESEEVISKVDERLAELTGNPVPVVKKPVETEEEEDDSDLTPEDKNADVVDDADNAADDTDGDAIDGGDTKEGEDKDDGKAIPEQLFRAATRNEWKPEEITKFWNDNPELAKKTLEKMHTDAVNTNTQYAEHGRAAKELQEQRDKLENQKVDPVVPVVPAKRQDFVDIEAMKEEFGDGAANIIKQLNDALVKVTTTQKQVPQDTVQHETDLTRHERSMAAIQQMVYWFADDSMKSYEEFYGAGRDVNGLPLLTTDHLTMDQRKNRNEVIGLADDIEAGIQLRGGSSTIPDSLSRAHVILTKDIQTKVIRDSILKQGKKRSKGVTLRPSSKKIEQKVELKQGEHKEEKQIYSDAKRRLKELNAGKKMT